MKKKKSLKRSLQWISTHPGALNLDVPSDLLSEWTLIDSEGDPKPEGFYLAVFSFGYFQELLASSPHPLGHIHKVPASRIIDCFAAWQMKLALAGIHHASDLSVAPMPLFTFTDDEQVSCWPKATPTG